MRILSLLLALFAGVAMAQEAETPAAGLGVFKLGATIEETIAAAGPDALQETEAVNDVQRVFYATAPVSIAGQAFDLRFEFEPDRLGVIGLVADDPLLSHTQCLQRFRAVVAELEQGLGPLDGGRGGFEEPWPAPRTERVGASTLRFYAMAQSRGAVLHRAAATARRNGILEVTAWAWDGGPHNTPRPSLVLPVACRISIELKSDLGA